VNLALAFLAGALVAVGLLILATLATLATLD
jgi:hypothetical protein